MSKLDVLTPLNSQTIFIDRQPQMAFGVQSIDHQTPHRSVHSGERLNPVPAA